MLKRAIARADVVDYRFSGNMNRRSKKSRPKPGSTTNDMTTVDDNSTVEVTVTDVDEEGSVYLSGILSVTRQNTTHINDDNSSNGSESDSDEGSTCDMETSAFFDSINAEADDKEPNLEEDVEGEDDIDYILKDMLWNKWEGIGDNDDVVGPIESDHYNGSHGLKAGVENSFQTVLQCVFQTTPLDRDFFKRLATQSSKYACNIMQSRNSNRYIGHQWEHITTEEMISFFGSYCVYHLNLGRWVDIHLTLQRSL